MNYDNNTNEEQCILSERIMLAEDNKNNTRTRENITVHIDIACEVRAGRPQENMTAAIEQHVHVQYMINV